MKNKMKKIKILVMGLITSLLMPVYSYADPGDDITGAIGKFGTLFASIISAIGGVVLIWQIVVLALALKRRDPASTTEAMIGVAAGLLIVIAPQVVNYILS